MTKHSVFQGFALLVALAGASITYADTQIEVVPNSRPDPPVRYERERLLDNCNGNARPRTLSVSCTNVTEATAGAQTEFSATVSAKYGLSQAQLKAAVRNTIGRKLGSQVQEQDRISFSTPRGQKWNHRYDLVVQNQSGDLRIRRKLFGVTYATETIPFRYCISATYEQKKIEKLQCPQVALTFPSVRLVPLRHSGNPCRNGFKYFKLVISVKNIGNKLATGYSIWADVRSRTASALRAVFEEGAYIPQGQTKVYEAFLQVQCSLMPPGTDVTINVTAGRKGVSPDWNQKVHARLPY